MRVLGRDDGLVFRAGGRLLGRLISRRLSIHELRKDCVELRLPLDLGLNLRGRLFDVQVEKVCAAEASIVSFVSLLDGFFGFGILCLHLSHLVF